MPQKLNNRPVLNLQAIAIDVGFAGLFHQIYTLSPLKTQRTLAVARSGRVAAFWTSRCLCGGSELRRQSDQ